MGNFDFLDQYNVGDKATAEYPLYQLEGEPVLIVAPATSDNRPYSQASLRRNRRALRQATRGGDITMEQVDANLSIEKDLFGRHILKGWRGMKDPSGKDIPFNEDNAVEFMQKIPTWIFQEIRGFCTDPRSFLAEDEGVDEEDLAGNS